MATPQIHPVNRMFVRQEFLRANNLYLMHKSILHTLPVILSILLLACAADLHPPTDLFNAYNAQGGAVRASNYGGVETQPVTSLAPIVYKKLQGSMLAPPLVYIDDALLLVTSGGVVSMMRYDSIYWSQTVGPIVPRLAADSSGLIYAVTISAELHALHPNGSPAWKISLPSQNLLPDSSTPSYSSPLAVGEGVVIGSSTGWIGRANASGEFVWGVNRGASVIRTLAATPAVGIVAALTHNDYESSDTVVALDPATGRERWATPLKGARILEGPAIIGNLIVVGAAIRQPDGTRTPYAIALGLDGVERWRTPLVVMPRGVAGDAIGNIYLSGSGVRRDFAGGAVVSLDSAGKERWQVTLRSGVPAAPVISANWVYFISRQDDRTGLFTYNHEGIFSAFVPINTIPDVLPQPVITPRGQIVLAGLDQPVLVRGGD
jgi:outer membrane protein assembly factor BamB